METERERAETLLGDVAPVQYLLSNPFNTNILWKMINSVIPVETIAASRVCYIVDRYDFEAT